MRVLALFICLAISLSSFGQKGSVVISGVYKSTRATYQGGGLAPWMDIMNAPEASFVMVDESTVNVYVDYDIISMRSIARGGIIFNISTVPEKAHIDYAVLRIYCYSNAGLGSWVQITDARDIACTATSLTDYHDILGNYVSLATIEYPYGSNWYSLQINNINPSTVYGKDYVSFGIVNSYFDFYGNFMPLSYESYHLWVTAGPNRPTLTIYYHMNRAPIMIN